ncbi:hypothetical protein KVT40_009322 [Elsinoe batatas]|uniref:xylan 1,4-beta-xylosidase n=1 Tax=Elsinoe batatas TaxID=2601811 RepID=A0A8K0KS14_9PEZI|nr:hypothetical protein KVT40_009322 [Elsinoe batatas]
MAAAFDDQLIEDIGTSIGIEARAFGNAGWAGLDFWLPNVNPLRDIRWGRGSETPGEDVLRVKRYAEYITRGLDGPAPDKQRRIVSTCKHYAANDFEDWNGVTRHDFDARVTTQDLAEYFLPPFQQCARDSRVGSIMCAYNAVNGVPSCANTYLMQTILRDHWKWTEQNNYITSDCEAVLDVSLNHKYAPTNAAGTAACFNAAEVIALSKTIRIADLLRDCKNEFADTCSGPSLPISINNTGRRASDYVALAFVSGEYGPKPYPRKTLSAYTRLRNIASQSTTRAELTWTPGDLARRDEQGNAVLYPGTYTITIDEPTLSTASFTLTGRPVVLDRWPAPPTNSTRV